MSAAVSMPTSSRRLACADSIDVMPLDTIHPSRALNFVRSSWTANYRESSGAERLHINAADYARLHSRRIDRLLSRPGVSVFVAYPKGDRSIICGWVCLERSENETALHYVYVAVNFRRWGVATALLETLGDGPIAALAWTPIASTLAHAGKVPTRLSLDPFWIPKGDS